MDGITQWGPIQSLVFSCQECPGVLICGKDNLDKHNEMCHKGHQDADLEEKSSESNQTCPGKKSQADQDKNDPVSRGVNDGLQVRSKRFNETLDANSGIRKGLKKVAVESGPSTGRVLARRDDSLLNEQAGAFGRSTQAVLPNNFENGNKTSATSTSRMSLSEVTVKMESTVEGVFPGMTANATDVEVIYYDCKLCDVAFRSLQVLRAHLVIEHKIGPRASAVVMELQKSEDDNDEDEARLLSHISGEDSDQGVGAGDVKHLLGLVNKRVEKVEQTSNTGGSNEFDRKRRSRSPSVEILGTFLSAKAEGTNQGSASRIGTPHSKLPLRKLRKGTESSNVEVNEVNDQGRSSAVRISNRMQPQSHGTVVDFNCKWCPKLFARNADLTDHIRRKHPNQKIVKCSMCKSKTAERLLEKHISNRHASTQDQWTMASASKAILTPQPSRSRPVISSSHNNAAGGGEEIYGASSSPSTTRNRIATAGGQPLKSGVRATNRPKKDENAMNRKQDFNRVSKLAAGIASAGRTKKRSDNTYQCDECPESFRRPCHLEDHKAIHTGEGPYTCPVPRCGRQDWCRYEMNKHMKRAHPSVEDPAKRAAIIQTSDL